MREPDWKAIALYLAYCHAATAEYDGVLKSCSKSRRDRLAAICEKTMDLIRLKGDVCHPVDERRVVERLSGAIVRLRVGK